MVEVYHEHPAITSREYANGLYYSWNDGKLNQVFLFLLKQADQRDLEEAKKQHGHENHPEFRQAIDKALETAPPAGSRHLRLVKKVVLEVLGLITGESVKQGPGIIIGEYILDEKERIRKVESEGKKQARRIPQTEQRPSCTLPN